MKKILLSLAVLLVTVYYVNAQSYTLSWDGEVLPDTITLIPDTVGASVIEFQAIVNNNTTIGANIVLARNEIYMEGSSSSEFCWAGVCWPPAIDTSGAQFIPAGGSSAEGDLSVHYTINDAIGVSLIEYTFYNEDNPDENVKIVINFDTSPDAIDENIFNNINVSEIYPNPATNFVNIDYDIPSKVEEASVKIVNLLGSVVKEQQINTGSNKMRMDISELNGGIYFYSIFVDGEIFSTRKLIVR